MGFIKRVVLGGACAFFVFNFVFGSTFANSKHTVGDNGFLTNLLNRSTVSQNGNKTSLYQELSKIGKEVGLNVEPEEWFTNPNKVQQQAFDQINNVLMEACKEVGINIESTGDFNADMNEVMGASMQMITHELNMGLTP